MELKIKIILCIIMALLLVGAYIKIDKPVYEEKVVTVCTGDTLWDMAREYAPGMDAREWVYEVNERNGICSRIYAGQEIIILEEVKR